MMIIRHVKFREEMIVKVKFLTAPLMGRCQENLIIKGVTRKAGVRAVPVSAGFHMGS